MRDAWLDNDQIEWCSNACTVAMISSDVDEQISHDWSGYHGHGRVWVLRDQLKEINHRLSMMDSLQNSKINHGPSMNRSVDPEVPEDKPARFEYRLD